ncbi:MAG TPA: D-aminoacyl-tRNA deacylase [Candidatus Ratteibacteria bacterium]|jgi:D-tyrosyl-tRNA(Tyr) deacylase|uniref:D-aminoacyl-tRNA deacylase n=1 Tax=candidate division TA06 bacterium ADurb.Bin131 TaxID=1852827 RepID=A0A1V6C9J1_UNCT6|nr:MAG: D-tyrosyl-tRNA(Tyr) deacylase [candidate division TA06 bacterium ADurb.Bin131]HOC02283.1 D-aminoacyl-tRNA deacylase [bacterium]HRS05436.1 D-aminoacyl-tRNA deacylase [Candidatus Ratteibacteria bacterium]HON05961.1 D-aminoacyl-tRNA deacylase [bacterium]HPC28802.1 D-aminoacyl-tRNA deacylase [bacterium]
MKLVIQRVSHASLEVNGILKGSINKGMVIFVGFGRDDNESMIEPVVRKTLKLRIFSDDKQRMNLSIMDISGDLMIVSQFTLYANTRGGNRPDFLMAMQPSLAEQFFNMFIKSCRSFYSGKIIAGDFGRHMAVEILNDGPVTIILDFDNGKTV